MVYTIIAGSGANLIHFASNLHFTLLKHLCLEIPQLRIYLLDTITKSIYNTIPTIKTSGDTSFFNPDFPFDREPFTYNSGTQFEGGDPLQILNFYDPKHNLFEWFNSFNSNILAITLLNVVVFVGIYIALKRKDTI